jgi:pimeloyl-ACP methyl ester carboxylesterase
LYEDFIAHEDRLNIQKACEQLVIPRMVIHGTNDSSVNIEEGRKLSEWLRVPLFEIPNANHTFGGVHPLIDYKLPGDLKAVVDLTLGFVGGI